jgi:hypothetical protein
MVTPSTRIPGTDFKMRDATTFAHHFLDLAIADRVRHIPAHAPQNNIALKMAPFEFNRHYLFHRTSGRIIYQAAAQRKFATEPVGAIHGRLLTAWSAAGVLGPVLVDYIRQYQIGNGVPKAGAYSVTMYIMAGLLLLGAVCNFAVRPVSEHFHRPSRRRRNKEAHDAGPIFNRETCFILGDRRRPAPLGRLPYRDQRPKTLHLTRWSLCWRRRWLNRRPAQRSATHSS